MTVKRRPCGFSIDLVSKEYLDIVSIIDKGSKGVTIEGSLGRLLGVEFMDGSVLVVMCENGVLRVDLSLDDIRSFQKKSEISIHKS